MTAELKEMKKWIGEKETDTDYVALPAVHRLSATLDRFDFFPKSGDVLADGKGAKLWARDDGGALTLSATVEYA